LHRDARVGRELGCQRHSLIQTCYQQRALGHHQFVYRNILGNVELSVGAAALDFQIVAVIAGQVLEPICGYKITDLFKYFSDYASQIRLVAFSMTTEDAHFSRLNYIAIVVASLKQEAAIHVYQN